jgi:hypothetical protein
MARKGADKGTKEKGVEGVGSVSAFIREIRG